MTKQTRKEMETVISRCASDKVWTVFSDDGKFMRKFEAAGAKVVRKTGDGKTYELDLKQVSFRTKKGFKFEGDSAADNVNASGLSKEEMETHINITADGTQWEVYTSAPEYMRRMERIGATFVKRFSFGKVYKLDMNQVSIRTKKASGEQAATVTKGFAVKKFTMPEVAVAA